MNTKGWIQENLNSLTAGLLLLQVVFMILIGFTIRNVFSNSSVELGIEVGGLQQSIDGLPDGAKESIESQIYQAVSRNTGNGNISNTGVIIRDGSLTKTYFEKMDLHYVSFIADIPEVQQSYKVFYKWSDNPDNDYVSPNFVGGVTCLGEKDMIYGDFGCDGGNDYLQNSMVFLLLRGLGYMGYGSERSLMMLPQSSTSSPNFAVKIYYRECVTMCMCVKASEVEKAEALGQFDDLVISLGFESDDIPHYFYNCENGMN